MKQDDKKRKQIEQQVHQLIKKIDQDPHNTENYLELSSLLIEGGSYEQAQSLLEKANGLVSDPSNLAYNLAVCHYLQGNFDQALKILDQLPNDDYTLYQKALVFFKLNQTQKALAYAMTIKNRDNKTHELIGDIWLNLGEMQQSYQAFHAIPKEQRSAKVLFLLGFTIFEKDREKANSYFKCAKKLDKQYYETAKEQYLAILSMLKSQGKYHD